MLRCDREYLLVGALIYRKPLRSITNRLERGDQCVVRFDGSLYRNIIGLAEIKGDHRVPAARRKDVPARDGGGGKIAPCLCDARKERNALSTLIYQHRLTQ